MRSRLTCAASFCLVMLLLSVGSATSADPDVQVDAKSFRCITKLTAVNELMKSR